MDHPVVFSNELFLDRQNNIPVFTVPMTLVALVFLMTTDVGGGLARVDEPSYPEKQVTSWHTWSLLVTPELVTTNMCRPGGCGRTKRYLIGTRRPTEKHHMWSRQKLMTKSRRTR